MNLGILAHVDAGKTTLTERLLYAAGVIDTVGAVDAGTTRTDTLELERQRGITIRAAVVSFEVAGVPVNLIDTPGHPDFIAEVERVLSLLDGVVLVISAVEGVQPQTRVLMRALRRLRVPTLLFVNKIDRRGADPGRVLDAIRGRLTPAIVPMGAVEEAGTRRARFRPHRLADPAARTALIEALADRDDALLAAYVEDERAVTDRELRAGLAAQTRRSLTHPVFLGSAITGEGVAALRAGLVELLPAPVGDERAPAAGRVFKIDRGPAGEKIAYVRMFAGTVRARERLPVRTADGGTGVAKATAISVSAGGTWVGRSALVAGEIGRLWGLAGARIGDTIGQPPVTDVEHRFAPPTLETVVSTVRPADEGALRAALAQLAEEDPLINVRADDSGREVSVSLYGEVQMEVIQATLATEFGIDVTFRETTVICVERPVRRGEAVEPLHADGNPFRAGIGLRVEPGPPGSGIEFRLRVGPQTIPMYVYRNADGFADHMAGYVRRALAEGRFGWRVTDCVVTMIASEYSVPDGPPSRRGPLSTPADFRDLTPLVLMAALERASTVVCEPVLRVGLEVPVRTISGVLTALGRLGAAVREQTVRGELTSIEAAVPAARMRELHRRLPGLTAGEGVLETAFDGYRPVHGPVPTRPRTTADPRHRQLYLLSLTRQGART
ncbi:TetM/TetW/TetO/TetS family tetracycline resistance ribosomal protection protein [Solwaraspora sp. WMMD1047]|uniref:elongation factor G n=1 Tax=Solwaraspora sp. WMMD1047 TaxID=3016102 RepID=UPI00241670F0|nr:TetM/TetW/TetO/TetS family tetracycline resistance ribosomal protection protein [Solwaraspora sp. WMMD1047]MDG4832569.1 TetM/TetW/TetO/TetS family tetracycline resistance ribosomal protection protein [Solwaraspora sp. WMMD1047]